MVLGGLSPARLHILRSLVHYLFRYKRAELIRELLSSVHRSYATPVEIGRAWFRRAVLACSSVDPLRSRPRLVMDHIDTAFRAEWQQRWHAADTGCFLHDLFKDAREAWMPEDIARYHRPELVLVARFMTGPVILAIFAYRGRTTLRTVHCVGSPTRGSIFLQSVRRWRISNCSGWRCLPGDGVDCGVWCGMIASDLVVYLWGSGISF